jgi:uncharacterized membrane protein YfcA
MIIIAARFIVIFFGLFIILIGFLMLFKPTKAREILRKAASTSLINYGEITLRLIPAFGLIITAEQSKFPIFFQLFGWCMLITSLVLYFIPMKMHHAFSNKSADLLKPLYFQFITPFAFLIGGFLIYCVV